MCAWVSRCDDGETEGVFDPASNESHSAVFNDKFMSKRVENSAEQQYYYIALKVVHAEAYQKMTADLHWILDPSRIPVPVDRPDSSVWRPLFVFFDGLELHMLR